MGFMSKIKNILFEEEEIEEPIKKEEVVEKPVVKKEVMEREIDDTVEYVKPKEEKVAHPVEELSDRELFKSESTFKFPAFDEEEFEKTMPKVRPTNVMAYEKKKEKPRRVEYNRYERTETVPVVEKKKFKPSPIISPVYGILDKDYKPEDIMPKRKDSDIARPKVLDVDSVRKKAFGTLEDDIEKTLAEPTVSFYEEPEEVKLARREESLKRELEEKVKTIDELLEDSATDEIPVSLEATKEMNIEEIENELENYEEEETLAILDGIDDVEPNLEEDTLESDLFDLIDSMYESREGEE